MSLAITECWIVSYFGSTKRSSNCEFAWQSQKLRLRLGKVSQPHGGVAAWSAVLLGGPKHFVLPNYKFRILMFQHISNLENVNFKCFVHRHRSIWSVPHVPPACSVVQSTHPVCEKRSEVSFRRFETSDFSCLSHSLKLSKMLDCVVH